jgi:hypothetical protein
VQERFLQLILLTFRSPDITAPNPHGMQEFGGKTRRKETTWKI